MSIKLITIQERHCDDIAINTNNISSIRKNHGVVYIHLSGDKTVGTYFKSIQEAINTINSLEENNDSNW